MFKKFYEMLFGPKYMCLEEEKSFNLIGQRFNELLRYRRLGMISEERYQNEKQLLMIELDNLEIRYN